MTIHGARVGRLFGIAGLVLLLAASAANAWGKDGCVSFKATFHDSFFENMPIAPYGPGWVNDSYFTIGGVLLHGTIVYSLGDIAAKKSTTNNFLGTEIGVVNMDGGGTFELVSHFVAPHQAFTSGVAIINESGTIGNGTGRFAGISGHFTSHGIYGPGVPSSPGALAGAVGTMEGNICGVNL